MILEDEAGGISKQEYQAQQSKSEIKVNQKL